MSIIHVTLDQAQHRNIAAGLQAGLESRIKQIDEIVVSN